MPCAVSGCRTVGTVTHLTVGGTPPHRRDTGMALPQHVHNGAPQRASGTLHIRLPQRTPVLSPPSPNALCHTRVAAHGTRPSTCHPCFLPCGLLPVRPTLSRVPGPHSSGHAINVPMLQRTLGCGVLITASGGLFRTPDLDGSPPLRGSLPVRGEDWPYFGSRGPSPRVDAARAATPTLASPHPCTRDGSVFRVESPSPCAGTDAGR